VTLPSLFKKILEEGEGFVAEDAGGDFAAVVETGEGEEVERAAAGSGLGVADAEDDAVHADVGERAGAHGARFLGDVEGGAVESPGFEEGLGFGDGEHFGVGGGVLAGFDFVGALGEDFAVADEDGADGDFLAGAGLAGEFERALHEEFVRHLWMKNTTYRTYMAYRREGGGIRLSHRFGDLAEGAELGVALFLEVEFVEFLEFLEVAQDDVLDRGGGGFPGMVGATGGFGDDFIDEVELEQVGRGHFERGGGLGRVGLVFPEDGGAAFGRDDGVVGVFEDEDAVGDADAERAAAAAFAEDDGDDGDAEGEHFAEVDGDGLGDVAFLGGDAGIGAGGVDEADDREAEFVGEAHEAEGLAVAFGMSEAEVVLDVLLGVVALLVADDHDALLADAGEAADEGAVVAEAAVAAHFDEVAGEKFEVIEGVRPGGVADDLDALPRGEAGVELVALGLELGLEGLDFWSGVGEVLGELGLDGLDFLFEFNQRFFKLEGG